MEAGICVHNNGGHSSVNFRYDTDHYVNNVYGNQVFNVEHDNTDDSRSWGCSYWDEEYDGLAAVGGSIAHAKSYLENTITVTG